MYTTGVKLFLMSKVQCVLCFEICVSEGRGRKGRGGKFQNKAHRTFGISNNSTPIELAELAI